MPAKGDLNPNTAADSKGKRRTNHLCEPQMDVPEGKIILSGDIEHDSIVNGPGLRAVIWTQGCRQHCPGCQNPETWAETDVGTMVDIETIKDILRGMKGQSGLTFCGGEPLLQAKACREITDFCHQELGWNVWSFTGLVFEQIPHDSEAWKFVKELDALIDGPFIMSQRDLTMKFRGSRNQRILHLKHGKIVSQE